MKLAEAGHLRAFQSVLLTLAVGAAGGAALAYLAVPAGWLSGAMIAVGAATLSGAPMRVPAWLRDVVYVFLGVSMGTGVTPETLASIAIWPFSIVALGISMAALMLVCTLYLHRIAGWERRTAFFASVPGALSYVMAMALSTEGVEVRRVAVSQSLRLLVLVAVLPGIIVSLRAGPPLVNPAAMAGAGLGEVAALIGIGTALGLVFRYFGFPGGLLTGSFVASAVLHATGLLEARLPGPVLIPGFVILGAMIGTRFAGATWGHVRTIAATSLVAFALAMVVSLASAGLVSWGLGLPFGQTLLAFAPGGLEVMTLLAFLLSLDPAYVAAHQMARYIAIALLLPVLVRLADRRGR